MKSEKAAGPSEVTADLFTALGGEGRELLWDLIREVWKEEQIPDEWRQSVILPIYKRKGDILECGNYRAIKLMEHGLKVMERIVDQRLREIVKIDESQ